MGSRENHMFCKGTIILTYFTPYRVLVHSISWDSFSTDSLSEITDFWKTCNLHLTDKPVVSVTPSYTWWTHDANILLRSIPMLAHNFQISFRLGIMSRCLQSIVARSFVWSLYTLSGSSAKTAGEICDCYQLPQALGPWWPMEADVTDGWPLISRLSSYNLKTHNGKYPISLLKLAEWEEITTRSCLW